MDAHSLAIHPGSSSIIDHALSGTPFAKFPVKDERPSEGCTINNIALQFTKQLRISIKTRQNKKNETNG